MYRLLHWLQAGLQDPEEAALCPPVFPQPRPGEGRVRGEQRRGPWEACGPKGCGQRPGDCWARAAPRQAPGPSRPSSHGAAPAVTPRPDDSWPWKMGFAPPGASKSQAQPQTATSVHLKSLGCSLEPVGPSVLYPGGLPAPRPCPPRGLPRTSSPRGVSRSARRWGGRPVPRVGMSCCRSLHWTSDPLVGLWILACMFVCLAGGIPGEHRPPGAPMYVGSGPRSLRDSVYRCKANALRSESLG